jgi:hypothetical protein
VTQLQKFGADITIPNLKGESIIIALCQKKETLEITNFFLKRVIEVMKLGSFSKTDLQFVFNRICLTQNEETVQQLEQYGVKMENCW